MDEYILNDESVVNSHGFVLLNKAGRFERYNTNPVLLFNHDSANLIGRLADLRVQGTQLIGKAEFDEEDPLAAKCKRQADKGYLKGCSPGIMVYAVEYRTNPKGEDVITITDWELCETSLVAVPSNRNALRLYNKEGIAIPDDQIKLSLEAMIKNKPNKTDMEQIILTAEAYTALGLKSAEADGKSISAAIMELQARVENAEKVLQEQTRQKAIDLVALAIKDGRITAAQKESFEAFALSNYDACKETLDALPVKESLSGKINHSGKTEQPAGRENWTYLQWAKEDPEGLKKMKAEDPEAFAELKKHIR